MNKKIIAIIILVLSLIFCLCACKEKEQKPCEHQWNDGVVTKEADIEIEGETTYTCTLCGETKTESIPALPKPEIKALEVEDGYNMPYAIKVNRKLNYITIYEANEEGKYNVPVRSDLCSCGIGETEDNETPLGSYYISKQWDWATLIASMYGQYTSRFNGDILFHSVPYSKKYDPSTLYGEEYNKLGSPASHGCVRLTVEAAKFIYDNCKSGTLVVVVEDDETAACDITPVLKISPECTWDPTDTDPNNPWLSNPEYMLLEN